MKEQVQIDNNDEQKQGEITGVVEGGCPAEDIKQGHTYRRRRQGLQIDGREGEVEKREKIMEELNKKKKSKRG